MADPSTPLILKDNKISTAELDRQAIDAALTCNWQTAEKLNRLQARLEPQNTECLNRLGRALLELGKYSQAKKIYQVVLEIDPYNSIAQKNLKRVQAFKKNDYKNPGNGQIQALVSTISPSFFLEESGITKAANLIKVAEPNRLSRLYPGVAVKLVTKNRGISVTDFEGNYLGVLADDTSHLLLRLIKGGNKFEALIKSVKLNGLTILIREVYRSARFRNQPSFLDSAKGMTYSSDHITLNYEAALSEDPEIDTEDSSS